MQKKYLTLLLITLLTLTQSVISAQSSHQVACMGFYNCENLFDTENDPNTNDEEFLPEGRNKYTEEVYQDKLKNLSRVLSEIGTDASPDGLALFGLAEIENRKVLKDLVSQPSLKDRNYMIIHEDCKYSRGMDVALIYNPKYFREITHQTLEVKFDRGENKKPYYSRNILWVIGVLGGVDTVHVFVNHWPSRRGGEKKSSPKRQHCAKLCKAVVDSLTAANPDVKIFITGDLNDDPVSPSVKDILLAKRKKKEVRKGGLYNPMWTKYAKGDGTLTWNDSWNLFDQIIVSSGFLNKKQKGFFFQKAVVYRKNYLVNKDGRFKNSPFRAYSFGKYIGGFSDHLPVYSVFYRKVSK